MKQIGTGREWLAVKCETAEQIAEYKKQNILPTTSSRKLAKENREYLIAEFQEMVKRVSILCDAPNLANNVIVDELISVFETDGGLYHLTLAEVYLAFKNGVGGKYGQTYGKPNFTTLVNWLNAFELERMANIENAYIQGKPQDLSERTGGGIKEILKGLNPNK